MADINNRQQLAEVEYLIQKYYNEHIAGLIGKGYREFLAEHEAQTAVRGRSKDGFDVLPSDTVKKEVHFPSTDDILNFVRLKCGTNQRIQKDIYTLTQAWEAAAVKSLGREKYESLCKDGNLAESYVKNRLETLMLEQFARSRMPKSSLEYIVNKGFGNSLVAMVASVSDGKTATDEHIDALADHLYKPSAAEKVAAGVTTFAVDAVSTGGYGGAASTVGKSGLKLAGAYTKNTLRYGFMAGDLVYNIKGHDSHYQSFDEYLGEQLFGDKQSFKGIRSDTKKVKPVHSEFISDVNAHLQQKVKVPAFRLPFNEQERKDLELQISQSSGGDAGKHVAMVESLLKQQAFSPKSSSKVPQWMLEKDLAENMCLSSYFLSMAVEMKQCGIQKKNISGKMMSYDEIAQRGYDYGRAADYQQRQEQTLMEHHAQPQAQSQAASQQYAMQQPVVRDASQVVQGQSASAVRPAAVSHPYQQPDGDRFSQSMSRGWSDFLSGYGLNGFGDFGKNFGYVLSMLPEMLIGMFTGKAKNFGFRDGLFPLAAIFMGMFVKNPLLKMLLIGLGGANLINKAGHFALEHGERAEARSTGRIYRQYADEPLDARIKQPAMKGYSLLANIDGNPCVIGIDEQSADAYYKGKVPLNTLCNAVLRKYDEQQAVLGRNFNQGLAAEQEEDRRLAIK